MPYDLSATERPCLRILGASLWNRPGSVLQDLLQGRRWFTRVHAETGVKMAFLSTGAWLILWLEGEPEAVDRAWDRAIAHQAHRRLRLLHRSLGAPTLRDPVHIASLHTQEKPTDVARRLKQVEREHELGWITEPAQVWQELSAPWRMAGPDTLAFMARRGVVALTSEHNESVDVLRGIAEHNGTRVFYQRFAGGDTRSGDVGAAYTDLTSFSHVTRVQAVSRRALGHDMVRRSLEPMHALVLLLGDRPKPAIQLAEEVSAWLAACPQPPLVRVVGSEAACALASDILRGVSGLRVEERAAGTLVRARVEAVLDLAVLAGDTEAVLVDVELG